jgi:hypothetical protein
MPGPRSSLADSICLTDAERATLEQWQRSPTLASGLVRRGQMILLVADAHSVSETARRVGVERWIVRLWARRFQTERLAGLKDRPRSGRPPVFPPSGRGPHGGAGLHPAG